MAASLQTARLNVFFLLSHVAFGAVPLIGSAPHFSASNFVKYVNSTTNFSVSGTVMVEQMPATPPRFGMLGRLPYQRVSWDLTRIDPACSGGDGPDGYINRCGIHIHEGRSCSEDAGGHLYKGTTRLGFYGAYYAAANMSRSVSGSLVALHGALYAAANLDASVSGAPVAVFTNLTASDILGRAVIVYDSTPPGRPIACALLTKNEPSVTTTTTTTTTLFSQLSATHFVKYVNSTTNFSVSGTVTVEQMPERPARFGMLARLPYQRVSWDLAGIDPACSGGEGYINRCGIHIHEGRSCSEDAGGHLYKGTTRWGFYGAYYAAANMSRSVSGALVALHGAHYAAANLDASVSGAPVGVSTNLTASDILGRAVIVYDSTPPGRPIACALLTVGDPSHATTTTTTTTASTSTFLSSSSIVHISVISSLVLAVTTI